MDFSETEALRQQSNTNRKPRTIHWITTSVLILIGMILLDVFLVEQNTGSRKTGVLVMLVIGELCLCLGLRYAGVWVGAEVTQTKRACAMVEWFLFVAVFDVKVYFILTSMRESCADNELVNKSPLQSTSKTAVFKNLYSPEDSDYHLDIQSIQGAEVSAFVHEIEKINCEYSLSTKKMLTLMQVIVLSGLYMLLVGADYLKTPFDLRELEEIKMRAFWIAFDIVDILDLQSYIWEAKPGELSGTMQDVIFFYGYVVLIILPPVSFAEMSRKDGEIRPHVMLIYLIASLFLINIISTAFRLVLIFQTSFPSTSSVFIGKNIICLGMKITKLVQIWLSRKESAKEEEEYEQASPKAFSNRNILLHGGSTIKMEPNSSEIVEVECPQHGFQKHVRSCECDSKPETVDYISQHDQNDLNEISESSTFAQVTVSSNSHTTGVLTSMSNLDEEKSPLGYSTISKRVNFNSKRRKHESNSCRDHSSTSESERDLTRPKSCRSKPKLTGIKASSLDHSTPQHTSATWNGRQNAKYNLNDCQTLTNYSNHILTPPPRFACSIINKTSIPTCSESKLAHVATSPILFLKGARNLTSACQISNKHNSRSLSDVASFPKGSDYNPTFPFRDVRFDCEHIGQLKEQATDFVTMTERDKSDFSLPPPYPQLLNLDQDGKQSQRSQDSDADSTSV